MPTLSERLAALRARNDRILKPEISQRLQRQIDEQRSHLEASGALRVGDRAPAFALPDQSGTLVSSTDLLANGSLVVTFFSRYVVPVL